VGAEGVRIDAAVGNCRVGGWSCDMLLLKVMVLVVVTPLNATGNLGTFRFARDGAILDLVTSFRSCSWTRFTKDKT